MTDVVQVEDITDEHGDHEVCSECGECVDCTGSCDSDCVCEECIDCEVCLDEGCDVCDPDHHQHFTLKHIAEDVDNLADLIACLRTLTDDLEKKQCEGWTLTEAVDGGHVLLSREKFIYPEMVAASSPEQS